MGIFRKCLLFTLIFIILIPVYIYSDIPITTEIKTSANVVINPDWLRAKTLKYGTVGSLCLYQSLTGLTEGYHFRQSSTNLINKSNYHTFAITQRVSGIVTGWFVYAQYKDATRPWYKKISALIGSGLIARNFMEWNYKYARYGNPFDYTEKHNQHSIVYVGIKDGKLTDMYIGTGPISGPIVDIACLVIGKFLLDFGD